MDRQYRELDEAYVNLGFSDNFAETLESSYSLWQGLRSESLRLSTDKRDPEGRSMRLQRLN